MTKIVKVDAFLVDIPVETLRTDALQTFVKQETPFVSIVTDDGNSGLGYSYTIGTGGTAVLAMLRDYLIPQLIGKDARNIERIWLDLFGTTRATATGAITSLALATIDTALWDLKCRRAGEPLWLVAGGFEKSVPLYDTEGGWLHLSTDDLVQGALRSKAKGWSGVKLKVGKRHLFQDVERLGAVRDAVGQEMHIMVDANQSMTLAEAKRRAAAFAPFDLFWFEEPLPADDIQGHIALARSTPIPIAVGESMYSPLQFREYMQVGAASIVQVDVARVGGITPWLKVAHAAETFNIKISPHFLMELHVSLAAAVPNSLYVEYIPQLRTLTRTQIEIRDGMAVAPESADLGIDWDLDAIENGRVA